MARGHGLKHGPGKADYFRMDRSRLGLILGFVLAGLLIVQAFGASAAFAYRFSRPLREGDTGWDVRALKIRVAGWYPSQDRSRLRIDRRFTPKTVIALKAFQSFYGLTPDGVAGPETYAVLNNLQDPDGSTVNFDWAEFQQKFNPGCSAKANSYAGTFDGGMVPASRVEKLVRRLMWRLEVLRAKGGGHPITIVSGFRSAAYNRCIGGAPASQHMYGTAVDQRMVGVSNHRERTLAEATGFSGVGCYADLSHNHLDLRMENSDLPSSQFWWWPVRNAQGQDLDEQGKPCYGEVDHSQHS
jgi:hypothetical protein